MNREQTVRINAPAVVGEVIDHEAIVVNLKTGIYYSFNETASEIWSLIQQNASVQEIIHWMSERYPDFSNSISAEVDSFLQSLNNENLVLFSNPTLEKPQVPAHAEQGVFVKPAFERYSEMANLLLLDPIHDVDEEGWPHAR